MTTNSHIPLHLLCTAFYHFSFNVTFDVESVPVYDQKAIEPILFRKEMPTNSCIS